MKIAYVSLIRLPTDRAHGYATMKMCEQFSATGAEVKLMVPTRRHGIRQDPFEYYRIKKNFTIQKLWTTDLTGRFERSRTAFFIDQLIFLFSVALKDFSKEILYTRDYQIALVAQTANITIEVHNIPYRKAFFLKALGRAKRIIVISHGLMQELQELGVPVEKIAISPDAVDLQEFNVRPDRTLWREFGVSPSKKIALYTGHFYGWKGGDTFAEAGKFVSKDTQLVLMGGVDLELKEFKEKYASDNIHIVGFQPRDKIAKILMSADVLVLPNNPLPKISSIYTSPLKLFQYMAAGVPIVASDLPSIREILKDDMTYWFTSGSTQSLAEIIEYAISHPDEAKEKAARAKEEAKKYTWDVRARTILEFIRG
jgi:glycosyltransferase involved in cell wall biosynthesis